MNISTFQTRRDFLGTLSAGLGGIALSSLLRGDAFAATPPHHAPKAKRVIQLFMNGGASQCDLFDYKPLLIARHGQKFDPGDGQPMKMWELIPSRLSSSEATER